MITLESVAVGHGPAALVPPLDLALEAGEVAAVAVETDDRPTLVSLLVGGRLVPDEGRVLLDGRPDARGLHAAVALVDTPGIGEPAPGIRLATAVAEELAAQGRRSGRRAVREALERHDVAPLARAEVRRVPTADRIRLLAGLAAERPGVRALVLTSPDRHGGDPLRWAPALSALARDRGLAVLVVTDAPTARVLRDAGVRDASLALNPETTR